MNRLVLAAGTTCALLAAALGNGGVADAKDKQRTTVMEAIGLGVGYRPPPFSATDLQGHAQSLKPYEGSIVVLHFWASWCPYCRSEIEELVQLHRDWAAKGVRVLTVSTDADGEALKQFVAQAGLPYPVIFDGETDPSIVDQYGISGVPVTYILSRDGHIASRLNGSGDITGAVKRAMTTAPKT